VHLDCFIIRINGTSIFVVVIIIMVTITFFFTIIIIIIIIIYHLYARHLQLHTRNKPYFKGILYTYFRSYSVVTIYGACNVISRGKPFVLLH
jgi:hypothetical protein